VVASEASVTVLIALYLAALAVSTGFFLWAAYSFVRSRRKARRQPAVDFGPDSDPSLVALYCQYLVAPQKALQEAQQAIALVSGRHGAPGSGADFFDLLDTLQAKLPASSSH
jgi:hypothetical protein